MTAQALARYAELVAKVDEFARRLADVHAGRIVCRAGCDGCCGRSFSVFLAEAERLREGFRALGRDRRALVRKRCAAHRPGLPCPLLEDGLCLLYTHRPIICRTHGLPVKVDGRVVSPCALNFRGVELSLLDGAQALDLDTLNHLLAAVNLLYMKEAGLLERAGASCGRVEMRDVFAK